jgi:hypothetical protein
MYPYREPDGKYQVSGGCALFKSAVGMFHDNPVSYKRSFKRDHYNNPFSEAQQLR